MKTPMVGEEEDETNFEPVDDLLALGNFNEVTLLANIKMRYFKDEIYTGIGDPILISVNPYRKLSALYTNQKEKYYRETMAARKNGQDVNVVPHLFSVAGAAYMSMITDGCNQSIIVSGESGAGKTEATKRMLHYLANLQSESGGSEHNLEHQVLRANPILEAFGNAKTIRNDNSSRFGKYIEIEFDKQGKLQSARTSNYLLEKCRIVTQQPDERNYHSFYQLCAGAEKKGLSAMLHLQDASQYTYLQGCTDVDEVDDAADFEEMTDCMISLGFTTEERDSIFKIVAAVIKIGDLSFELDGDDGCKIPNTNSVKEIASLFGVEETDFANVYRHRTMEDPFSKKIINMPQDIEMASKTRESMAKVVYSRLFDWLVWRINQSTIRKQSGKESVSIGILDIYGFEVFEWNSFEQLCINFANEKLQQHFNAHMFTLEQKLYTEEGITWDHITFQDNQEIIDSLEKKPLGLFCILDSECNMPKSTDTSCLNKIYSSFSKSKIVYKPTRFASTNFAVAHYAGVVIYDVISFLEKNTDKMNMDIINLLAESKLGLCKTIFSDPKFSGESQGPSGRNLQRRASGLTGATDRPGGRQKQNVTVSMMFREQLDKLVDDLNKTHPSYIRCIKPNGNKAAHDFNSEEVQRQLRCAGMLECIRIRKAGYPVRKPFKEFFNRFRVIFPRITAAGKTNPDFKALCRQIMESMEEKMKAAGTPLENKSWQMGRSKVFLKQELQEIFDKVVAQAVQRFVRIIQKRYRGFVQRRAYKKKKAAALALQSSMRTSHAVMKYRAEKAKKNGAIAVQACLRAFRERQIFQKKRKAAIKIQKIARGRRCRQKIGKLKGKMAEDKIKKLREEEEKKEALAKAQKDVIEMQTKLREEQEKREAEFQKQMEEEKQQQQQMAELQKTMEINKENEAKQAMSSENEKLKEDLQNLRKENARLQGTIDSRSSVAPTSEADLAEMEHLRNALKEVRDQKIKLEVELTTSKSAEEFDAKVLENQSLQEDIRSLTREKQAAQDWAEMKTGQLEAANARSVEAEQLLRDLADEKSKRDDLEIQLQRTEAQKVALEQRLQDEEKVHKELRELRMEKMKLQSDLDSAKVKEEMMDQKMKEMTSMRQTEQTQRHDIAALQAELDAEKGLTERLKEQNKQLCSKDNSEAISGLRNELFARFEQTNSVTTAQQGRVSFVPPGDAAGEGEEGGRKTLLNQREMFEKFKADMMASSQPVGVDDINVMDDKTDKERIQELEESAINSRREASELKTKLELLESDMREKNQEIDRLLELSGRKEADIQSARLDQQEFTFKLESQARDYEAKLQREKAEADHTKKKLQELEGDKQSVRATIQQLEAELQSKKVHASRLEKELEDEQSRSSGLSKQCIDIGAKLQAVESQADAQRSLLESSQEKLEMAERTKAQGNSELHFLKTEVDQLKAERDASKKESQDIKAVLDDVMQKYKDTNVQAQCEEWKQKARFFEKEYNTAKALNKEMTMFMGNMSQMHQERGEETGEVNRQNKILQQQLAAKAEDVRQARAEKDEIQRRLDELQAQESLYQQKYREADRDLRTVRQEHGVAKALADKFKARTDHLLKENEDLNSTCSRMRDNLDATQSGGAVDVARYQQKLGEFENKMRAKNRDLENSQAVNDCLNTLLCLTSEQQTIWEMNCQIQDETIRRELVQKKDSAKQVIERLHGIVSEEDFDSGRPSFLEQSRPQL